VKLIVALEGALATGKSTIAAYAEDKYGGFCIEEVKEIFDRPKSEPQNWYYERQLDRLLGAKTAELEHDLVMLSGDPYQPVWFNWMFPDWGFEPWQVVLRFFSERQDLGLIPDFFGFTHVEEDERYKRLIARELARGHDRELAEAKHARYQPMTAVIRAYFESLESTFPGFVVMLETSDLEQSTKEIRSHRPNTPDSHQLFSFMEDWFSTHKPGDFNVR